MEGTPSIALVRPADTLELLRLDQQSHLAAAALTLGDRFRKLQGAVAPAAIMMLVMLVALVVVIATGWRPDRQWWGQMAVIVGAIWGGHSWRRWRLRLPAKPARTAIALTLIAVGAVAGALTDPRGALAGVRVALGSAVILGLVNTWALGLVRYRLPSGRRLTVIMPDLLALRIRWAVEPATITVLPPDGDPLDEHDSHYVLTHLVEWVAGLPDPVLEQAGTLAASTPHLGDLLRLLPGESEARLDDLPQVYWAALDFALSRERDAPDQIETVEEARRVAEIAEGLDG